MTCYEKDFVKHTMPSGSVCYYRDDGHSYWEAIKPKNRSPESEWSGSGRLTGISTVSAPFDWVPNNLMDWAVRINLQGVAELVRRHFDWFEQHPDDAVSVLELRDWLTDGQKMQERIAAASLSADDYREERGEEGSNVHEHTLHALASGQSVPSYSELTESEQAYSRGVEAFWLDHDPEPLQAEQVVCDLGLRIAGRLDFRGVLRSRCGRRGCPCAGLDLGSIALLDLKTGGYISAPSHVQIAGYDHGARMSGFGPSDATFILQVNEQGQYTLIPGRAKREDFLTAIEVYRRAKAINKAASQDRKAAVEAMVLDVDDGIASGR